MPTAYGDQPAVGGQGYGGQSAGLGFEVSFYASLPKICISLYKSLFYISTHDHKIIILCFISKQINFEILTVECTCTYVYGTLM